jgi:hypothetical protein
MRSFGSIQEISRKLFAVESCAATPIPSAPPLRRHPDGGKETDDAIHEAKDISGTSKKLSDVAVVLRYQVIRFIETNSAARLGLE